MIPNFEIAQTNQNPHRQLHRRIPPRKPIPTIPAPPPQPHPAQHRHIIKPPHRMPTVPAMRPRPHHALPPRHPSNTHIQEAAQQQPHPEPHDLHPSQTHALKYKSPQAGSSQLTSCQLTKSAFRNLTRSPSRAAPQTVHNDPSPRKSQIFSKSAYFTTSARCFLTTFHQRSAVKNPRASAPSPPSPAPDPGCTPDAPPPAHRTRSTPPATHARCSTPQKYPRAHSSASHPPG